MAARERGLSASEGTTRNAWTLTMAAPVKGIKTGRLCAVAAHHVPLLRMMLSSVMAPRIVNITGM